MKKKKIFYKSKNIFLYIKEVKLKDIPITL